MTNQQTYSDKRAGQRAAQQRTDNIAFLMRVNGWTQQQAERFIASKTRKIPITIDRIVQGYLLARSKK